MKNKKIKHATQLANEIPNSDKLPYSVHISPSVLKTREGDYLSIIKLGGLSFETADEDQLDALHEARNNMLRNIAHPSVSVWTNIIRRKANDFPEGEYSNDFTNGLYEKYRKKVVDTQFYVNELYVTVIKRPPAKIFGLKNLFKKDAKALKRQARDNLQDINDIVDQTLAAFGTYDPELLTTYENNGIMFSQPLEFLGYLFNGTFQPKPLLRERISNTIGTSRIFFGREAIEVRRTTDSFVMASLGIKEYTPQTSHQMFDEMLTLPFEFNLAQSFSFIQKDKAVKQMIIHRDRMTNAGDHGVSQIEEIEDALDDLVSNRFAMGEHHMSFLVKADTLDDMSKSLAMAESVLGNQGIVSAREDLALEASFWSLFPGNFGFRTRKSPVTSRNFAGFSPFHNFPQGKLHRNLWGDALTTFKTTSSSPYHFNFHRADLGNALVIGPSGTGKTVFMGFSLAAMQKYDVQTVFFDKDRGAEVAVRAMGGQYQVVDPDYETGFNPLQMEPTPSNIHFLNGWIEKMVEMSGEKINIEEADTINRGLKSMMNKLAVKSRRLSVLVSYLTPELKKKLSQWYGEGKYAFMFDNAEDKMNLNNKNLGFDITSLLDDPKLRTPTLMYIFFRVESLMNGQRFAMIIDEGWKALDDEYFEPKIKDLEKTIRKRNGIVIFGTNNASDATKSSINSVIVEQSPTKIFMPNINAKYEDYVEGFDLSEKEFRIIKELPEKSRKFLLKHGDNSVVAILDLGGMDDEIAVLSGTSSNVAILEEIRKEVGDDPADWMPIFQRKRDGAKPVSLVE